MREKARFHIFDLLGKHVRTLVQQQQAAGRYSVVWDGRNENGQIVASGMFDQHANGYKKLVTLDKRSALPWGRRPPVVAPYFSTPLFLKNISFKSESFAVDLVSI